MAKKTGYEVVDNIIAFAENNLGLSFSNSQIETWTRDLNGSGSRPRTPAQLKSDILRYRIGSARIENWLRSEFTSRNLTIATGNETETQRLRRIANELLREERTFQDVVETLNQFGEPSSPTGGGGPSPPDIPTPSPTPPAPTPPDEIPPVPDVGEAPEVPERDYEAEAQLLFPYLPTPLREVFVNAWIEYGDQNLALAKMRQSDIYERYFPGNRRPDGTLRMSELEYGATLDAFDQIIAGVGVNPEFFQGHYEEWIRGDVSINEAAERVDQLYRRVLSNDPERIGFLAEQLGVELDTTSLMAAALDPDLGQQIFNREIDIAEVRAEASRQGFRIGSEQAAGLIVGFGVQGTQMARPFFSQAAQALPSLQTLAERFDTGDQTVDLAEFAQGQLFGEASQSRRLQRLLGQSQSQFTVGGGIGAVRNRDTGAVSGLRAR